eukprot:scaffold131539_cov33-Tisochrysis_lutea.AAC.3
MGGLDRWLASATSRPGLRTRCGLRKARSVATPTKAKAKAKAAKAENTGGNTVGGYSGENTTT